jgi:hypothetical protein
MKVTSMEVRLVVEIGSFVKWTIMRYSFMAALSIAD